MLLADKIKEIIRDVPDFPKPGILFKDITPVLASPALVKEMVQSMAEEFGELKVDVIIGIESRGFIFGALLANELGLPFVPVRKAGKLPHKTISQSYALEYGEATLQIHHDALQPGSKVIIHDDLLATGGTAAAAGKLVQKLNAEVSAFSFLINLSFLKGEELLAANLGAKSHYLVSY